MVAAANPGVELAIRIVLIAMIFVQGMSQSTVVMLNSINNGDTVCRSDGIIGYTCSLETATGVARWIIGRIDASSIDISFSSDPIDTDQSMMAREDSRITAEQVSIDPLLVISLRMPVDLIGSVDNVICQSDNANKSIELISGDVCLPPTNVRAVRVVNGSTNVAIMVTFEPSPSRDVVGYNVMCSDSFCELVTLAPSVVIHGNISADVNVTVMVTTINRCGCQSPSSPFTILLTPATETTAAPAPVTLGRDAILAIVFGCLTLVAVLVAVLVIIPLIFVILHYKNKSEENAFEALESKKDAKPSQGDTNL